MKLLFRLPSPPCCFRFFPILSGTLPTSKVQRVSGLYSQELFIGDQNPSSKVWSIPKSDILYYRYLAFTIIAQLVIFPSLSTIFTLLTSQDDQKKDADATGIMKVWVKVVFFLTQVPDTYQTQAKYILPFSQRRERADEKPYKAIGLIGSRFDGSWPYSSLSRVLYWPESCLNTCIGR